MKPVNAISFLIMLTVLGVSAGAAQSFGELGMMSGTGLTLMPSTTIAPASQFRVQFGRISLMDGGGRGVNMFEFSGGLSQMIEGYFRMTDEQQDQLQSLAGFSAGGKITLPFALPVLRQVALWGESSTTDQLDNSEFNPVRISRAAFVCTPISDGFKPTILMGFTKKTDETSSYPYVAAGLLVSVSHSVELGGECLSGYSGIGSRDFVLSSSFRLLPFVSMQVSPGYTSVAAKSSWLVSAGLSFNTADIDFKPPIGVGNNQQFQLPSLEEIEKETKQEKQQ